MTRSNHQSPVRRAVLRLDIIAIVFAGGCLGGWARYAITSAWVAPATGFPWATLAVNVTGAFVLALVIIIAADVAPSRYLRPLLGTGFCGAFTTFSAVVVASDRLFAHNRAETAIAYLAATILGGLAASALGLVAGRSIAAIRRRSRQAIPAARASTEDA